MFKEKYMELIYQLDAGYVKVAIIIIATIISLIAGYVIYSIGRAGKVQEAEARLRVGVKRRINERLYGHRSNQRNRYIELEKYIKRTGISYYFNGITPEKYIASKIIASMIFMLLGLVGLKLMGALIGCVFGYYSVDVYCRWLDKRDNSMMLDDIRLMLGATKVQNSSNTHIINTINSSYYSVSNPRLKKALMELIGEIKAKVDIDEALDNMASKFNNVYISSYCASIKQLMKTGRASNMMDGINKNLRNIQSAMIIREKHKIESNKLIASILVFITIIFIIGIVLVSGLEADDLFRV